MALLLKQLDIHGFKSFAAPTSFVFDRGITAVIGPNGSGKSNVAEALRWVLGEQAGASLRSRRTEDVIFAGSDKRAQLAMAEVVLTLDNTAGDLPLPFAEITVARRAFRGGENQYLINGARVRLKDVQQLVAPLGQSYTIIGQGLVDAALSARPEERRGLFEHAAGISGLRLRATDAERSLTESDANAQRLRDILSELEPRVRSLERQARLARDYGAVRDQLTALQRRYYAAHWAESMQRLGEAREALHTAGTRHAELESRHAEAAQQLAAVRGRARQLAESAQATAAEISGLERALADTRHQLALLDQRAQAASERRDDLVRAETASAAEAGALRDEVAGQTDARATNAREIETLRAELARLEAAAASAAAKRREAERRLAAREREASELGRAIAQAEGSLQAVAERELSLASERQELERLTAQAAARVDEATAALAAHDERLTAIDAEIAAATGEVDAAEAALVDARARHEDAGAEVERLQREHAARQARLDVLERAHASGDGMYAGVRALLRAIHRSELALPGMVGTLAEIVETPREYETAIEVALGGHLQDVVVERWADAQQAIDFLKRTSGGRATFQPLDTVRTPRRPALDVRDPDLLGIAADLVRFPDTVSAVVEQALGRTLVVRDLAVARRLVRATSGWSIVTLTGEITRPSGAVTGGSRVQEAGILARERERRSLPREIAALDRELSAAREASERASTALAAATRAVERARADRDARRTRLREESSARDLARRDHERAVAARGSAVARVSALSERAGRHHEDRERLRAAIVEQQARRAAADREIEQLREVLAMGDERGGDRLASLRTELATASERQRAVEERIRRAATRIEGLERAAAARAEEIARIDAALATLASERDAAADEETRLTGALASARELAQPLGEEQAGIAAALSRAEQQLDAATERLREAERERDRATLGLARVQDEQVFLQERIRNDLDGVDPTTLTPDDEPPPDDSEIARVRERLRRMSVVSDDVLEQYETESQRLAYLRGQLEDVEQAAAGLRRVLAELNQQMATRFEETFRDVAAAFSQTFTRLFGGGSARLVLSSSEDGAASIDIVAQPPGKRLQNLTALSGGERALTAVALLIAIQRVNPSPFCLLDEVDAALDESNVVRFRDELRELAGGTQYVVITHNRGTIEGADTLYGVTMGADGVSRVLSLRLEEAIRAVEELETASAADD